MGLGYRCIDCGALFERHSTSCGNCFETGCIVQVAHRAPAAIDSIPEVTDAESLVKCRWDEVRAEAYPELRIGRDALLAVSGGQGEGKTTWLLRLLDSVAGTVVCCAGETGIGPQLGEHLSRLGIHRAGFRLVGRASLDWLHAFVTQTSAVALGLDSVTALQLESDECRHLVATTPLRLVVAVAQLNASGQVCGKRALLHEADVHVEIEQFQWRIAKSRYQPSGLVGDVLPMEECSVAS
jgi:predicted ATP-dependent serine protease